MKLKFIPVKYILLALAIGLTCWSFAQNTAQVYGVVTDADSQEPVELVTIYLQGTNTATESDASGNYRLNVPAERAATLVFSRIGYKEWQVPLDPLPIGSRLRVDIRFVPLESDLEVIVTESKIEEAGMQREDVTQMKLLPTTTGNLESVLPHIALGATSGTGGELSSQYNVRGGNYDENLVYVNDFEIYRPQLIRAGQQEGLTFPNIDLISSLSFSSGGFEARYGDKLSSVLDIKYKRPDSLRASAAASLLGGSAHLEGSFKAGRDNYKRFRYLLGARYKTTRYLLGSLDITGEYLPNFTDFQGYFTYDINRNWQLGFLGNLNRSVYEFVPGTRSTGFGLIDFALNLFTVYEGREIDNFTTAMGGLSLTYIPDRDRNPYFLKFLSSSFQSNEDERFDIIGHYSLRQIESNLGSDSFGEVIAELGSGTQQQFVRNYLTSNVSNLEHKGGIELQQDHSDRATTSSHFLQWSAKYQREWIDDRLNEWERLDSAGYSLPYDTNQVLVSQVLKTRNTLTSGRMSAYFQDTYTFRKDSVRELKITAGVRSSYWDLNQELLIAPRAQLLYKSLRGEKDISYRLAGGMYFQPPFYRELRDLQGIVHTDVRAQKSAQIVGGLTYDFYLGKRAPKAMRFIAEAYYKWLWDLVSYDVENVRIRYAGANNATGYVTGLDFRLNGEFVPGAESWINVSLLRARESITGVDHMRRDIGETEGRIVKDVARPTDKFMTVSVFFQDYLPKNENFKVHVNLTAGTGLPYGIPNNNIIYRNTYRFPGYHRVDIGFSFGLWDETRREKRPEHFLRFSRSTWLSLEVFNLLQVRNEASKTWIKTIFKQQYAVPNFLTSRRLNLRLRMDF